MNTSTPIKVTPLLSVADDGTDSADRAKAMLTAGQPVTVANRDVAREVLLDFDLDSTWVDARLELAFEGTWPLL